ncbi:MAG: hypothetical protein ACRDO2_10490 [Nocardioidaceae bacterium]
MYEVSVAGLVPIRELLDHVDEAESAAHRAHTTVSARLPDQAALHALLHRLRALGLDVTEVRRMPSGPRSTVEQQSPGVR